ncbi:hypothetical protein [Actinoalloteichus hymeniacidonis]|uniref:Nuclease-like protein n=1 Tax=Actinoalloteichus hymeniacidonis TaxID=340345 RepID=A0AAC9MY75_9PSEU|nr:hypothetical protein [Actinoalloteichus hymeniacidonis]AOS63134.1 hypothetical protein TL08_11600 [Actinoalloteichus hymeniacidonis]MBB5908830.1 hypothetical protein [Actinoalloteichus hymeniacidonis]
MQVVGTQRAKLLSSTAGSWFRQRLLETGRGAGPAGLAYFEVPIPMQGGPTQQAHAILLTPAMLIVVELRSLPWYRGGRLRAETSGTWTVDGMDAGLRTEEDANPGERVTRLVFALREHLRVSGARSDAVAGLVCVAGPDLKVRQDRSAARFGDYLVCANDHQSLRRTITRLDRGGRRWSSPEVHAALLALNLGFDVPSEAQLAEETFVEHSVPEPRQGREDAESQTWQPDDGQEDPAPRTGPRRRRGFKPEALVIPALMLPAVIAVLLLVLLLVWVGRGVSQLLTEAGADPAAPSIVLRIDLLDGSDALIASEPATVADSAPGGHASAALRPDEGSGPTEFHWPGQPIVGDGPGTEEAPR